ncbi:hypothetical protein [Arthrobacter sp. StoSoilB13]|uniref:hypothetical protein n=1 Tax=Arthrobacter sp. StoSoilB13 TaxID=2830993 RepID=UPI001E7F7FB6|nr:hypothetical protein StoSoilB13_12430 [Arthrobacter sp. StoSoilB13]
MNGTPYPNGMTAKLRFGVMVLGAVLLTTTAACSTENKGPQVSQTSGSHPNGSGVRPPVPRLRVEKHDAARRRRLQPAVRDTRLKCCNQL